ncbi:MAG: aspartate/glutamate racemase family protein [Steroidobacteraceae bacterium]|jgi:arylmalonate decarboxylase|nr:aspartate/glutamate racemase family protein [Steroidobacteraceae bacterium]
MASDIRIGVLVPAGNTIHEREFAAMRPAGVEFRFAGFSYPPADAADFCVELTARMAAPIEQMRAWGARLLLVGCTAASMRCADAASEARLAQLAGVPVVTAAGAAREACVALGLRSVAVATPYGAASNGIVARYLASIGVEVAAIRGLDLDRSPEVWKREVPALTPVQVCELGQSIDGPAAEALYLPCTGLASIEAIELWEARTGKPAFSSVQAGFWASLRRLGLDGRQGGAGRLVAVWPAAA